MLENVSINCQSSIKISSNLIIYFDPYLIKDKKSDADIIFITHDHYDHFDLESINNVIKKDTIIVVPNTMVEKVSNLFEQYEILGVDPNKEYNVKDIKVKSVRAYNNDKKFHPINNNWVGYIVTIDDQSYYIMGDTDDTVDTRKVSCDYLFVPIGGTYTMNYLEAAKYTNYIKPKVVVPIHYKTVVGSDDDYNGFIGNLDNGIKYKKYI